MQTLFRNARYGLRMLAKSPGFTALVVLSLALGIGANTAIFSAINALMLRTLPVHEPAVVVWAAVVDENDGHRSGFE